MFGKKPIYTGRRPVIAGNWKMNCTWNAAVSLAQQISFKCDKEYDDVDIVICPPFTSIKGVSNVLVFDHSCIKVGAQNVYEEMPEGNAAATGNISVEMLEDFDCAYCIVGHSECREHDNDTDELVNKKARLLLDHGIAPILCCGESLEVNQAGGTIEFVSAQIKAAFSGIPAEQAEKVVIGYEPIWAIGTGLVPLPEQVESICASIRSVIAEMYGAQVADKIRILYGGSLKPANAHQFLPLENVDGGLIGGASLDAESFKELVKMAAQTKRTAK